MDIVFNGIIEWWKTIAQYQIFYVKPLGLFLMVVGLSLIYRGIRKDDKKAGLSYSKRKRNHRLFKYVCLIGCLFLGWDIISALPFPEATTGLSISAFIFYGMGIVLLPLPLMDIKLTTKALNYFGDYIDECNPFVSWLINKIGMKRAFILIGLLAYALLVYVISTMSFALIVFLLCLYLFIVISNYFTLRIIKKRRESVAADTLLEFGNEDMHEW